MKKQLLLLLFFVVLYFPAQLQAQIASWDFSGQNQLPTSTANTYDPGLTAAPVLTRGAGAPASMAGNSFRTTGFRNDGISVANTDYYEVTLAVSSGKTISLSTINAIFAGTGAYYANSGVSVQFAYSLDGTNFTLIGAPSTVLAANVTNSTTSPFPTISLSGVTALQNVASGTTITLRFYASGQTATGGWGFNSPAPGRMGFDIGGNVSSTGGTDNTPPVNALNYPKTNNISSSSIDLLTNINEPGTTYYVLIPASGTAPTNTTQIKNGQDGNGIAAFKSGSIPNTANIEASTTINGLNPSTAYKIFSVSADAAAIPNLQTTFSTLNATTLNPDVTAPVNTAGYPKMGTIGNTTLELISNINEDGTTYYVLIPATGTAPTTTAQIKAGLDGNGIAALKSGLMVNTANTDATQTITGLVASTAYNIYLVASDATSNTQTAISILNATTKNPPALNIPVIISQYYEGTSTNKWIELSNLSNSPVNTATLQLKLALYNISGDAGNINITPNPSQTVNLNVIIPAQGTVLIGNTGNGAEVSYLTPASAAQTSNLVINFNGNDGVTLLDNDNNIIDAFGQGINAKDISYVRNISVTGPTPTFNIDDWTQLAIPIVQNAIDDDDLNRLGVHLPPNLPPCVAPATIAGSLIFSNISTNSITGSFTAATDANEYLIIRSLSPSLTALPVDGTVYNKGTAIGGGIVAARIVGSTFTDTGLPNSTKYYYFIFSLNNISCTGGPKYLSTNSLNGSEITKTPAPCAIPASQPTAFTVTSSNYNFIQGSYTPANNADEYLVVMSTNNTLTASPVNQTVYTVGDALGGGTVIKRGTGNSFIRNGLAQNTTYYFYIFALNSSCSGGPLYLSSSPLTGSHKTGILDPNSLNFYYGNLHSHSSYSDGNKDDKTKKPEDDYEFAKNSMKMDFLGLSEHNHTGAGMSLANWQPGMDAAKKATTSTFLALHGMEWGVISGGGHVIVYGIDSLIGWETGEHQIYVPKSVYTGPTGLFRAINRHGLNAIATLAHPSTADYNNLLATYDLSADSAIVGTALESGPAFSTNLTYSDPASSMSYLGYYNRMLAKGYRLGASIDHDNHNLTFGRHTRARLVVLAPALTENDLLDAIKKMRFYASQDSAAKVTFTLNKMPLGSTFTGVAGPVISVSTATTNPVTSIKLMYGTPGSGVNPTQLSNSSSGVLNYTHSDLTNLATGYYYADILETDGSRIITSPIWYTRDDSFIPKTQTITFNPTRTATYGDPDMEIGASSDNTDINLTYTTSDANVATITDHKIRIVNAGVTTITANQEGNALYSPATPKQQILTVAQLPMVVTAENKQKLAGAADPVFTYTSSTAPIKTDVFSGQLSRNTGEAAGTYQITQGNLALSPNYSIDYKPATLTIHAKASGTISGNTTVAIGSPAPMIIFTATAGVPPFTFSYQINGGETQSLNSSGNTAMLEVPTQTPGSFTYTLTNVRDANSSQPQTGSATVVVKPLPVATISGSAAVCVNGTPPAVTFNGTTGTAPFTFLYSINGGNTIRLISNTNVASTTAPSNNSGLFTYKLVSVTDAYGTQAQTGTATITINALPVIQILSSKGGNISKGDVIQLTATGGTQYSWTGNEVLSGQNSATVSIRPKQSGNYKVTVTNASGCSSEQSISISVADDYKLEAGTLITPNGDGINDRFVIKNIDYYPKNTLRIFDQSGRVLFQRQSYANDWDGTVNGSPLLEGTYYYILDMGAGLGNFKGYINIIRD
ncbi:gliding motility-associated C-terminal domain-containing protein [Pedobacter steynii]|uniref:Gliding motility-associated C-terminal domain-containing protein n=1 Tax=Pedobacter steynii TaxID=430522 RepID=A0A1G9RP37_9SPHI|nr:CehA/McbA family metallohydrolase [Pedobacter steynii]NQX37693.1 CehA/McbA family metallohydrolase [Pedobacter steynii]SDM25068.1 gliding motility-associated C-terminal domain-containing protein [Pedobacter steynii]